MAGLATIQELLETALSNAPEADRNKLAQAIEDFAEQQPRAWHFHNAGPLAGLLDALVEGTDARPGLAAQMKMDGCNA